MEKVAWLLQYSGLFWSIRERNQDESSLSCQSAHALDQLILGFRSLAKLEQV